MADKPVAYRATEPVYVDGTLFKAGETFVTASPKGETWETVTPMEKAAAEAAKPIKDDVNLEALDVAALKGHAASLGINLGEAKSKADIITVIKAYDDPTR